jgi:hypothetical protein
MAAAVGDHGIRVLGGEPGEHGVVAGDRVGLALLEFHQAPGVVGRGDDLTPLYSRSLVRLVVPVGAQTRWPLRSSSSGRSSPARRGPSGRRGSTRWRRRCPASGRTSSSYCGRPGRHSPFCSSGIRSAAVMTRQVTLVSSPKSALGDRLGDVDVEALDRVGQRVARPEEIGVGRDTDHESATVDDLAHALGSVDGRTCRYARQRLDRSPSRSRGHTVDGVDDEEVVLEDGVVGRGVVGIVDRRRRPAPRSNVVSGRFVLWPGVPWRVG